MSNEFEKELTKLLNKYGKDAYTDIPDYKLAGFVMAFLDMMEIQKVSRENHRERMSEIEGGDF